MPGLQALKHGRIGQYVLVGAALALLLYGSHRLDGTVRPGWFVLADGIGTALAMAAGAVALAYFRSFNTRSLLFVSAGFLGAGVIQAAHLVQRLGLGSPLADLGGIPAGVLGNLYSQAFLASMLLIGWRASEGQISSIPKRALSTGFVLATCAALTIFILWLPADPEGRFAPVVLLSLALVTGLMFLVSLALFLARGDWREFTFQHGFVVFLLLEVGCHLVLAPGATHDRDGGQLLAFALRDAGYAVAFLTLLASLRGLMEQANEMRTRAHIRALIAEQAAQQPQAGPGATLLRASHSVGTFEYDLVTRTFECNAAAASLMGWAGAGTHALEELRARMSPEDASMLRASLQRSAGEGTLFREQFRLQGPDGEKWLEAVAAVESRDGRLARLLGFVEDVTPRKLLELESARLNADLQQMMEAIDQHAAIAMLSRHGRLLTANERFCQFFGRPPQDLVGKCLADLVGAGTDLPEWLAGSGAEEQAGTWLGVIHAARPDGSIAIAQGSIAADLSAPDADDALVYVGFDITARVEAEAALHDSLEAHRRSNEDLQMFAHIVSHDLQEPLRMVSSFLTLLNRRYAESLSDEAREFIRYAVEGSHRMRVLLDGLLEYSRVNSRGGHFETVPLNHAVSDALSNLAVVIEERGARVKVDALPEIQADLQQMTQLFQNLVANAIKFTPAGTPCIRIDATEEGGQAVIRVRDNGIGIDPAQSGRIFQIFQRLHARSEYPGSGVGLAVCKRIMERHGGRIFVESQPGQGSVFILSFPHAETVARAA